MYSETRAFVLSVRQQEPSSVTYIVLQREAAKGKSRGTALEETITTTLPLKLTSRLALFFLSLKQYLSFFSTDS